MYIEARQNGRMCWNVPGCRTATRRRPVPRSAAASAALGRDRPLGSPPRSRWFRGLARERAPCRALRAGLASPGWWRAAPRVNVPLPSSLARAPSTSSSSVPSPSPDSSSTAAPWRSRTRDPSRNSTGAPRRISSVAEGIEDIPQLLVDDLSLDLCSPRSDASPPAEIRAGMRSIGLSLSPGRCLRSWRR